MNQVAVFSTQKHDRKYLLEHGQSPNFTYKLFEAHLGPDTAPLAKGCSVACLFVNDRADRATIQSLAACGVKLIALRCAGYNNVDIEAAKENGIAVVRVPEYSPYAVAEYAMALLLTLNRKTHKAYAHTRELNFQLEGLTGFDLHGKTLGVVGTGRIGKVLCKIGLGFGMKVLAFDFQNDPELLDAGVSYTELDTLCTNADVVSLHVPLNKQTYHLIDTRRLKLMKPSAVLINTGRGGLVDTQALVLALKSNEIDGAALDVYEEEDGVFFETFESTGINDDTLARLLTFPNVLISSHQGFFTREALTAIANTTRDNIESFLAGKVQNSVF